jgi:hypothetical protein
MGVVMGVDPVQPTAAPAPGGAQTPTPVALYGRLWYRITDRLSWDVPWPAFSYRFGNPGGVEVMPFAGFILNAWTHFFPRERRLERAGLRARRRPPLRASGLRRTSASL